MLHSPTVLLDVDNTYLDLRFLPPVPFATSHNELSPSSAIFRNFFGPIPVDTHSCQIFIKCFAPSLRYIEKLKPQIVFCLKFQKYQRVVDLTIQITENDIW